MMSRFLRCLSSPVLILSALAGISLFALIAVLSSEVFLGLEPCILCVYQRWPYALVVVLCLIGLALKRYAPLLPCVMVVLSGLAFLGNSALALYHTGVEQKWWISAFEGCVVPNFSDKPQSILENIMSAPTANCAEIPWQDPILGLSMANYNVLMCFGLALICALSLYALRHTKKGQACHNADGH